MSRRLREVLHLQQIDFQMLKVLPYLIIIRDFIIMKKIFKLNTSVQNFFESVLSPDCAIVWFLHFLAKWRF